ncbi:MAG: glycoside hydrolase family 2 TIM barrel-domain containing protein [Candidatus Limiplasma sp.]|nr:glycoside hydrolase family 2 TIM barrel-domain containing protein [Candidatus Limiplasma sp.]
MAMQTHTVLPLNWLSDPSVFSVGQLPPRSDHAMSNVIARSLNGRWDFRWFETPAQIPDSFLNAAFWENCDTISVPGHMELQGYGTPQYVNVQYPWDGLEPLTPPQIPTQYNPAGVYRRLFTLSAREAAQEARIEFDGAESALYVYLNGDLLGYAEDSFTPSAFDVSGKLREGENELVAVVVHYCSGSWLEDQDFWHFSGLFRDVRFLLFPAHYLEDVAVTPTLSDSLTEGTVTLRLAGRFEGCAMLVRIAEPDGKIAAEYAGQALQTLTLPLHAPLLWSAETPACYTLSVSLDGKVAAETLFGFRRFVLENGLMKINGKRIVFRGVNRHEFDCDKGRAIGEEEIRRDLTLLKAHHFNAVRTSHYPNHSSFYRLCDQIGLYVIDEVNLETHGTWMAMGQYVPSEKVLPNDHTVWKGAVQRRTEDMFYRDRNHPSILLWSLGNECCGGSILLEMANLLRSLDSTRLIHYEGIYWDRRFPETSDVESRMYAKPQEIVDYLAGNPPKPYLSCEYAHAMGNSLGGLKEYVALEDQFAQYQGGFIWDFKDQTLRVKKGDGQPELLTGLAFRKPTDGYFCADGLLFGDGTPTPKFAEASALYAPFRVTFTKEQALIENRNLFQDATPFEASWKLLRDGLITEHGEVPLHAQPGKTDSIPLPVFTPDEGEWVLEVSVLAAKNMPYLLKGMEIAFGQKVYPSVRKPLVQQPVPILNANYNVGFPFAGGHGLLSKASGLLTSLTLGRDELLTRCLRPDFWRAPTDNDLANGNTLRWAQWKLASLYSSCDRWQETAQSWTAELLFPTCPATGCTLTYTMQDARTLRVALRLNHPAQDLPAMGMSLALPCAYHQFRLYGNLQKESYADRDLPRLGLREGTVREQFVPYVNPQENGCMTHLRWLEVFRADGCGLRFFADEPFEATVQPYDAHQLEQAQSVYELPRPSNTYIRILKGQCGVGGDDSWGAPVHAQYLFHADSFVFYIQLLGVTASLQG